MRMMLLAAVVALSAGTPSDVTLSGPGDPLHCRISAVAGDKRRCTVRIPSGAAVRACSAADSTAGRCDKRGKGKYVAWVVSRDGAKCRISKKRTDWTTRVTARMSDKTPAGAGACDLYVALR